MPTAKSYRIAIADDFPEILQRMKELLKQKNCEVVITALNGKELIEAIRHCHAPPDICLVDMNMPVMGGLITIAALKKDWPNIKVIACSASAQPHNMDTLKKAGANHFYQKGQPLEKLITLFSIPEFCVVVP